MPLLNTRGVASVKGFGFGAKAGIVTGSQSYTTAGTYSWVAPAGVTSVSIVAVGGGGGQELGGFCSCCQPGNAGGGGGGGLGYINNYSVTPGSSYSVVVGAAGVGTTVVNTHTSTNGGDSYFVSTSSIKGGGGIKGYYDVGGTGGTYTGTGGGNGGKGGNGGFSLCICGRPGGGGGAGGYSGNGSAGSNGIAGNSSAGTGGSASGGGTLTFQYPIAGGGGGVGLLGQGTSGTAGSYTGGIGGSGGANGSNWNGGAYGGGGGGTQTNSFLGTGGVGAVRIVWPGNTRTFPSTCVGSP